MGDSRSEPGYDPWGLSGLLRDLQKRIREAPPEAWDTETREAGAKVERSLSNRLGELERVDKLTQAVPCHHPRCELKVVVLRYGRVLSPAEAEDGDWWHINARGEVLASPARVDGEVHFAAPRAEEGER